MWRLPGGVGHYKLGRMVVTWLEGSRDLARVLPVLRALDPPLAAAELRPVIRHLDGVAQLSETVLIGATHVLKVTWTAADAAALHRHRAVLSLLGESDFPMAVPRVSASIDAPVAFLYELLPGTTRLTWDVASGLSRGETAALADDWAAMIAALQAPHVLAAVEAAGIELLTVKQAEPRERVTAIRAGLLPIRPEPWLPKLLDEVQATLAASSPRRALLHADLGGHNILVTDGAPRICGLIDLEQASVGDPAFDLRHLLAQARAPDLCRAVIERLEAKTGQMIDRRRVLAYYVGLDLGDITGRVADGRPVTGGVEARTASSPGRVAAARAALHIE